MKKEVMEENKMNQKCFTEKQLYASTFFGGPIPAGILVYKNLKRINDDRRASLTLMFTFIFTFLLFAFLFKAQGTFVDDIPDAAFGLLYTLIVYLLYSKLLKEKIEKEIALPENKESNWSVAGWTLLGLAANLIIIFGLATVEPAFPGDKLTFGTAEHEVFYDKDDFSETQVKKVGQMLTDFEYFYGDNKNSVRLEIRNDDVILILPFLMEYWDDKDLNNELTNFCVRLQTELKCKVNLELIHYEFSGEKIKMIVP